jgi:phage terminase small subunit
MSLTNRQQRFVDEYLIDLNATQAARRAGYRSAEVEGCRLLKNAKVAHAVAKAQAERAERTGVTADRVISELAKIGFSDIRKAIKWRSNVTVVGTDPDTNAEQLRAFNEVAIVDSNDIDDETAAAIAEISQTDKGGLKVKLHDKRAALVDLGKHLGLFKERVEHTGAEGAPLIPETPMTPVEISRWLMVGLKIGSPAIAPPVVPVIRDGE